MGRNASLVLTGPSSCTDKSHFPFTGLYYKHTSGGKRGLEVVEARPRVLIYLMMFCEFPLVNPTERTLTGQEGFAYLNSNQRLFSKHIFCSSLSGQITAQGKNRSRGPRGEKKKKKSQIFPRSFAELGRRHLTSDFQTQWRRCCLFASAVTTVTAVIRASAVWVLDVGGDDGIGKEVHLSL